MSGTRYILFQDLDIQWDGCVFEYMDSYLVPEDRIAEIADDLVALWMWREEEEDAETDEWKEVETKIKNAIKAMEAAEWVVKSQRNLSSFALDLPEGGFISRMFVRMPQGLGDGY